MTTSKTTARKPKTAPTATEQMWDDLLAAIESPEPFPPGTYTTAPVVLDEAEFDAALADLDIAYRDARVAIHGDFERAHSQVLKGMEPCWERPEYAGLGTQPAPEEKLSPRHAASTVSIRLLHRVRDGIAALAEQDGPPVQAGPVTAEPAAALPPLPQRIPGATQNAPALGESFGEPEWQKLPPLDRAGKPVSGQPVPWDGAPTTVRIIPSAVGANSEAPAEGIGELDGKPAGAMARLETAWADAEAPDFPAEPTHEERQGDEALDKADPLSVGDWQEPRTKDGEAAE